MHMHVCIMHSSTVEGKGWQTPGQLQPWQMLNHVVQYPVLPWLFTPLKAQVKARLTRTQPAPQPHTKPEGFGLVPPADTLLPPAAVSEGG